MHSRVSRLITLNYVLDQGHLRWNSRLRREIRFLWTRAVLPAVRCYSVRAGWNARRLVVFGLAVGGFPPGALC